MPDSPKPVEHPVVLVKGRGAGSSRPWRRVRDEWDAAADFDPATRKAEVTEPQAKAILNKNPSPDLSFDFTIDPTQRCDHGCVCCFARPTHASLNPSPGLDFETRLFAKTNAAEMLRKALSCQGVDPSLVALGASTGAYQPIDRGAAIACQLPQVLAAFDVAVGITTKSALVTRAIDLLAPIAKKGLVRVHMSVPTLDHELSRRLDPRANSATRRPQAIEELTAAGIRVAAALGSGPGRRGLAPDADGA